MRVLLAETMGMCFGVRDALAITQQVTDPKRVTIHGELVHNETVNDMLSQRGFHVLREVERSELPDTPAVLLTAHGASRREKRRLLRAGKKLIDTTCPLVARVHGTAALLLREGFHVLVIGRRDHVEVQGIVGDLDSYDIVESLADVVTYPHRRLGIIAQTTYTRDTVEKIRMAIETHNPQAKIRFCDTVCQPTKERQEALNRLIPQVDVMIVIGGKNSNNTQKLASRCREEGGRAHQVQRGSDLLAEWFEDCEVAGLTAGTSTLDSTIREVHEELLRIAKARNAKSLQPTTNAPA